MMHVQTKDPYKMVFKINIVKTFAYQEHYLQCIIHDTSVMLSHFKKCICFDFADLVSCKTK